MGMVMILAALNLACRVAAMFAAISAARFRFGVWREAGHSQMPWMVGPLFGALVFAPLGLVAAIAYVSKIRPELRVAALRKQPKSF